MSFIIHCRSGMAVELEVNGTGQGRWGCPGRSFQPLSLIASAAKESVSKTEAWLTEPSPWELQQVAAPVWAEEPRSWRTAPTHPVPIATAVPSPPPVGPLTLPQPPLVPPLSSPPSSPFSSFLLIFCPSFRPSIQNIFLSTGPGSASGLNRHVLQPETASKRAIAAQHLGSPLLYLYPSLHNQSPPSPVASNNKSSTRSLCRRS